MNEELSFRNFITWLLIMEFDSQLFCASVIMNTVATCGIQDISFILFKICQLSVLASQFRFSH